jgi:hypothetical protein
MELNVGDYLMVIYIEKMVQHVNIVVVNGGI